MFDLFFSFICRKDISERFNINQRVNLIMMGKTFDQSGLMFPDSFADIVCEPNIQGARLVRHNVNIVNSASRHTSIIGDTTVLSQISPLRPTPIERKRLILPTVGSYSFTIRQLVRDFGRNDFMKARAS